MVAPKKQWRDIETRTGIMISGGYLRSPYALETKEVEDIDEYHQHMHYTFVRLNKGQHWLYKSVAGADATRRDLAHLTLLDDIEKAVRAATSTSSDDSQEATPRQPAAKKYKTRRARDSITRITMPLHPPNCGLPDGTIEVNVFNDGHTGKGQWIDLDSVPWLVSYMRHEREHADCHANDHGDDTAVAEEPIPGVSVTWNWDSQLWTAVMSATVRRMDTSLPRDISTSPHELTREKWEQSAYRHGLTVDFDASTPSQRREVARCFLIHAVATRLQQ